MRRRQSHAGEEDFSPDFNRLDHLFSAREEMETDESLPNVSK